MYDHDDFSKEPKIKQFGQVYSAFQIDDNCENFVCGQLDDHYMNQYKEDVASKKQFVNNRILEMIDRARETNLPSLEKVLLEANFDEGEVNKTFFTARLDKVKDFCCAYSVLRQKDALVPHKDYVAELSDEQVQIWVAYTIDHPEELVIDVLGSVIVPESAARALHILDKLK